MSACSFEAVDALAFGELPPAKADEVSAHVSGCGMCELQLRRLREDRALLASRQRRAPVDLSATRKGLTSRLASRQREREKQGRRRRFLAGTLSAAALLLVTWVSPALHPTSVGTVGAGLLVSAMDPSLACRLPARWADLAIVTVETRYGACLVATPRAAPDEMALCL